ncbi:MAG: cupin domain-containing protein [Pseudomonadota bacterium]|nr:cupin domain-containing protein [Pseudomonadota bacterium]
MSNKKLTTVFKDEPIEVNQNFLERVVVNSKKEPWHQSPSDGVERIYLERNNQGEKAIATSIVRFAPNSSFEEHIHEAGEEFFVLDGIFEDEYGSYPKGTYIRNPHGSKHNPFSRDGCTIFVKLRQFSKNDGKRVIKDTLNSSWLPGLVPGLCVMPLHEFEDEHTALVKWEPNTQFNTHQHWGGEEIFVLEGTFFDEYGVYPKGSWIRSPHLSQHKPYTEKEGALIFVKTGNLKHD